MPITVDEKYVGRSGTQKDRNVTYLVRGTDDESVAIAETALVAPSVWDGLDIQGIAVSQLSDETFVTVVDYVRFDSKYPPDTGSIDFEFSYSATGRHVMQSYSTSGTFTAPGITARDFEGAINVVIDDGVLRVEGVDVPAPSITHTWAYYPDNAVITPAYQDTVVGLMGAVNSAVFKGGPVGEVRFVSCQGSVRTNKDWQIRYGFSQIKNRTGLTFGTITGVDIDGHEIVWFLYGNAKTAVADNIIKRPFIAYVERVQERKDLNGLGI